MRLKVSILIPLSLVLGVAAVQSGRSWMDRQMNARLASLQADKAVKPVVFATIVVAAKPLRFGSDLRPAELKEISWPSGDLPPGAYSKVADIFKEEGKRVALAAIENNEPILATKMTGPGQKANLAALIETGMKAVTVRVDDVVGVAGFVLPGDRVDILLTRAVKGEEAFADNILQNLRVLAIDQKADDRLDKPAVARAVTLEVTTDQAQRLIVAQKVGTLTMVLRPIGEAGVEPGKRVTSMQLANTPVQPREQAVVRAPEPVIDNSTVTVTVTRATERKEYSVPAHRR